jgi:hypothetical protein
MSNRSAHTYEEIRQVVVDILSKRERAGYELIQYVNLLMGVAAVLASREKAANQDLHPSDAELVRDVFWDLFRQGFITLGIDNANSTWPFFRLSQFGQRTIGTENPYRFHDTASYIAMVKDAVPDISPEAIAYLDEAVVCFYAGCLLASCVMLGVAAEAEFLRLVDCAAASKTYGARFTPVQKARFIRSKITKFQNALMPLHRNLPPEAVEDLESNFNTIQSVLRIARNEAGHPTGAAPPQREQVYVYLQLFTPFARQLMRLRYALN